jgi:hypothetical protein
MSLYVDNDYVAPDFIHAGVFIYWGSKTIFVPRTSLPVIQADPEIRSLDLDQFRLTLKDLEDDEAGMPYPITHRHNTEVVLSGVTYARTIEIVNGYRVEFESGPYSVSCIGANHNLADVKVANQVSLIIGNSAGLIVTQAGAAAANVWGHLVEAGYTAEELLRLVAAVLIGNATGLEGGSPIFRDLADTKNRVEAAYASGNRTVTTKDGS